MSVRNKSDNKKRTLQGDILLVGGLLLVGLGIMAFLLFTAQRGSLVQIRVDGRVTETLPLDRNITRQITTEYGTNVLVIENGEAFVSSADCPDGVCKNMGRISKNGQSVICLPHKLVIEISGQQQDDSSAPDVIVK